MDWRFVAFGWAGYLFVWGLAAYWSIAVIVHGQTVDLRTLVSGCLVFAPLGAVVGLMAESA